MGNVASLATDSAMVTPEHHPHHPPHHGWGWSRHWTRSSPTISTPSTPSVTSLPTITVPSTLVSLTRAAPITSAQSPVTGQYCSYNFEQDTSSCIVYTYTPTGPTPTPYETTDITSSLIASSSSIFSVPDYTCTNFACIGSVASYYGYSLCLASATPFPTLSLSWSRTVATTEPTCDPLLGGPNCPTDSFATVSTSSCDTTTSFAPTLPEWSTMTATKEATGSKSYSYHAASAKPESTSVDVACEHELCEGSIIPIPVPPTPTASV